MITILNEKKSSAGSPYIFYTITVNPLNRTANTVDLEIKVTSHLQYSSSSLGTGVLTGYFKINNTNYSVNIKSKSESWSGTTKHTTTKQITIEDLTGSQTLLEDITFRVARETGSSSSSGYLKETMCSDIEIPIGHTAPDNISYTITETDLTLQRLGIANNVFVENKSIKKFLFSYNLYDDATLSKVSIWNGASAVYSSNTNPLILDLKTQPLPSKNENGKITLKGKVTDSMNGSSFADGSGWDLYDVIEYTIPTINETLTTAKRNGQLTGKVLTNLVGAFFKGEIGNYNQQNLLSIKYKFWENSSSIEEPTEYSNTIPSESILYTNNTFKVLNYEIGSNNESDSNYFNPKKSYKIKFLIKDIFNEIESSIRAIPVGESTWTEYKDRVDFKRITRKGNDIIAPRVGDIVITSANVNPSEDYGGTWELIDKEFAPKRLSGTSLFTNNSTNTTNSSNYLTMGGHNITIEVGITTKVSITDTELQFGTFNLANIGIKAFNNNLDFVGFTDAGNCAVFMTITTAGVLKSVDIIPDASVAAGRWIDGHATFTISPDNMLDSACNKFYWKKTA